jgi:hypothetical protein
MITLGLGLLAASIVGLTIESGGIALVLFSRRGLGDPPCVSTLGRQEINYVRSLPTPARFRPLGPPMFDSPTITS